MLHVIEGPGGTRTLDPERDKEFTAALNTDEALHWVHYFPDTSQSKLAKTWLKRNYGTDNLTKVRKILARKNAPKRTWQDNPFTYATVIVALTVVGGLTTRYLSDYLPQVTRKNHSPMREAIASEHVSEKQTWREKITRPFSRLLHHHADDFSN